jgi:hypothetical protein
MYVIKGITLAPKEVIGKITLEKKIFSSTLYETWEVTLFEKDHIRPFTAHIFKYSLSGIVPLTSKEIDAFCLNILHTNHVLKERNLDIRLLPCYKNKSFNYLTKENENLTYILFSRPNGGTKLTNACNENTAKVRICRYAIKNLAKGILRLFRLSEESNNKYDLNYLFLKDAFYYGKPAVVEKVEQDLSESYGPITNFQQEISIFQKTEKFEVKNHFLVIPFLKIFRLEEIEELSKKSKEEKSSYAKIRLTEIGEFLANVYDGLDEAPEMKLNIPGDNFNPDPNVQSMDYSDVYIRFNKDEIASGKVRADKYFGVKKTFANLFLNVNDPASIKNLAKQNYSLLKNSYFEFIFKLINYYGDQFNGYEDALNHKFLIGEVFLNSVISDSADQ